MGTLFKAIQSHARFILITTTTIISGITLAFIIGPSSDLIVFINVVYVFCVFYIIYRLINFKEYSKSINKFIQIFYLFIMTNHYFSYKVLCNNFPWLSKLNKNFVVLLIGTILIIIFSFLSLLANAFNQEKTNTQNNTFPNPELSPVNGMTYQTENSNNNIQLAMQKAHNLFKILIGGSFALILIAITIYSFIYILKNNDSPYNIDFFNITTKTLGFVCCILLILLSISFIIIVLLELIYIMYRSLHRIFKSKETKEEPNTCKSPILDNSYFLSVIIFFVLLYFSTMNRNITLDYFFTLTSTQDYLAVPLTMLVLLVTFFVIIHIIHSILNALLNGKSMGITEKLTKIASSILNIVFDSIETILKFAESIPNFFNSLYYFVFDDVNKNCNDNNKEDEDKFSEEEIENE